MSERFVLPAVRFPAQIGGAQGRCTARSLSPAAGSLNHQGHNGHQEFKAQVPIPLLLLIHCFLVLFVALVVGNPFPRPTTDSRAAQLLHCRLSSKPWFVPLRRVGGWWDRHVSLRRTGELLLAG